MLRGTWALFASCVALAMPGVAAQALPDDVVLVEPVPAPLEARHAPSATVLVPGAASDARVQEATVAPVRDDVPLARVALVGLAVGAVVVAATRALFPARLQRTHAARVDIPLTDLREVLALARAAESAGDAERALALYRRALDLDPLHADARAGRSRGLRAGATWKRSR